MRAPLTPHTGLAVPAAFSISTNDVDPPNVTPAKGLICHSAAAGRGNATISSAVATHLNTSGALPKKQTEKQFGERRDGHIAVGQRERPHQTVAVRQQNQRQAARWNRDHQRQSASTRAELPDDGFAVVILYEPAESMRQRLSAAADGRAPRFGEC